MSTSDFNSGTAGGLLAFLEYVMDKGLATRSSADPLRSAAQVIFQKMEGESFASLDVRTLDENAYLDHFSNKFRTDYRPDSLLTYRRRFARALELYRGFLSDPEWRYPTGRRTATQAAKARAETRRSARPTAGVSSAVDGSDSATTGGDTTVEVPGQGLTTFTFPLRNGTLAGYLRLPLDLTRRDANRLSAFIQALVSEPEPSNPPGSSAPGAE